MKLAVVLILCMFGAVAMILLPSNDGFSRINGVSLVNPPRKITLHQMGEVKRMNADWVAVIPYGFSRAGKPQVTYDHSQQWWGEQTAGTCKLIEFAHAHDLKVMLKPHVWVVGEGWTGDYTLAHEEEWVIWEKDFTDYILNYAKIADSMNVELLCIGTEYRKPAKERPAFWRRLIHKVRKIYSGKVTYAANWDNYEYINWWDEVDYIGIDAYVPLVEGAHPTIDEIQQGWEPVKAKFSNFSNTWNKPILFTEFGFQSANGAAGKHWEVDAGASNVNEQLQADAFEATFRALKDEPWFMGGFVWKWHFDSTKKYWKGTEWTPQNKKAEKVIADWYSRR